MSSRKKRVRQDESEAGTAGAKRAVKQKRAGSFPQVQGRHAGSVSFAMLLSSSCQSCVHPTTQGLIKRIIQQNEDIGRLQKVCCVRERLQTQQETAGVQEGSPRRETHMRVFVCWRTVAGCDCSHW